MATLLSTPKWSDLNLVRALDAPFFESLERVFHEIQPLLATRPLGLEGFTDHDLQHSARVVERIGYILPADISLNQSELYLLLLAALLHDAGLWTPRAEAMEVFSSADFRRHSRKWEPKHLDLVDRLRANPKHCWLADLGIQKLVASYHRESHAERLATVLLSSESSAGSELRTLIGSEYIEPLIAISSAHSWEKERVARDPQLQVIRRSSDRICLRFLAVLLRIGDLLDLGDGRVSTLLWSYLAPMDSVAEAHWRKEMTLKLEDCTPDEIRIRGQFDVSKHKTKAADAFRLAHDWIQMLEDESEFATSLTSRLPEEFTSRLRLGKLKINHDAVVCNGLVWGENSSFSLRAYPRTFAARRVM